MLEVDKVSLSFATKTIFDKASFALYAKQKYGLIGKNGVGKTTLFNLILKKQSADGGDIFYPKSIVITAIDQECNDLHAKCIDYVMSGHPVLGPIYKKVKALETNASSSLEYEEIARLYAHIDEHQGFDIESKAATILDGLGFVQDDFQKPLHSFSGGWQMRLSLAKCLLAPSDLLLLDEPTNHLDMDAILWLEKWLSSYQGSLLLISHDRYFLDRVIDNVVLVENNKLHTFKGNYSQYEQQKFLRDQGSERQREKVEKQKEHLMSFVNRFKAKATKAKQAQSRLKMIEKLPVIEAVTAEKDYRFSFFPTPEIGNPALKLSQVSFAYAQGTNILENINISIAPHQKIGLLGFNGAGKTTLMKILSGKISIDNERRQEAYKLKVGYFAQHQIESLDLDQTPLEHLQKLSKSNNLTELRSYLGRFAFSEDTVLEKVKYFSGGEKSRLALALLIWQKPNVLLLDEPTNHLDLALRQALCKALTQFDGALVIVSHDRYILEATVDEFYLVHNKKVIPFDGTLDDYDKWSVETKKTMKQAKSKPTSAPENHQEQRQIKKEIQKIEKKIKRLELDLEENHNSMLKVSANNHEELMQLGKQKLQIEQEITICEELWLEMSERLV